MVTGFSVLSYPFVSDYWNQFHQTRAINNYVAAVDGINTHRMMVRGRRVDGADLITIPPGAIRVPPYIILPAVMIPLMFIVLVILLILYRKGGGD